MHMLNVRTAGRRDITITLEPKENGRPERVATARCKGCHEVRHGMANNAYSAARKPTQWARNHAKTCTAR